MYRLARPQAVPGVQLVAVHEHLNRESANGG